MNGSKKTVFAHRRVRRGWRRCILRADGPVLPPLLLPRLALRVRPDSLFGDAAWYAVPPDCAADEPFSAVSELTEAVLRKNGPFVEFSLCLSRACLVKMFVFIYEWLEKTVFTHLHSRAIVQVNLPNNATTHPFVSTFPIYVCPEPVLVK